jgi:hypothetical protein
MLVEFSHEELSRAREYRDEWFDVGVCTDPADRASAERAIAVLYRAASLGSPQVVWCDSPLAQALARAVVLTEEIWLATKSAAERPDLDDRPIDVMSRTGHRDVQQTLGAWHHARAVRAISERVNAVPHRSIRTVIMDGLQDLAADRVKPSMWAAVEKLVPTIRAPLGRQPFGALLQELRGPVTAQWDAIRQGSRASTTIREVIEAPIATAVGAWDSKWACDWTPERGTDLVGNALAASVRQAPSRLVAWQHEAASLATSSYLIDVCEVRGLVPAANAIPLFARSAGWALADEGVCWATERHCTLRRDGQGRLHSDRGAAVVYPDGWELYFWHGVRVPPEWIGVRDQVDPALVFSWRNLEQRRALLEIVGGWKHVLARTPTRVVDQHADPAVGTLLECKIPGEAAPSRFLRVRCGTGREFVLPVPRECRTAREANAWTYGLSPNEYELEART